VITKGGAHRRRDVADARAAADRLERLLQRLLAVRRQRLQRPERRRLISASPL
jgi:hypothetical protein